MLLDVAVLAFLAAAASLGALAGLLRPLFLFAGAALGWLAARHLSGPRGRCARRRWCPSGASRPVAAVLLFVIVTVVVALVGRQARPQPGGGGRPRRSGRRGAPGAVWRRRRRRGWGWPWPTRSRRSLADPGRPALARSDLAGLVRQTRPPRRLATPGRGGARRAPPGGRRSGSGGPARLRPRSRSAASTTRASGRCSRRRQAAGRADAGAIAGGRCASSPTRTSGSGSRRRRNGWTEACPLADRDCRAALGPDTCSCASPCRRRAWRRPGWRFSWARFSLAYRASSRSRSRFCLRGFRVESA